MPTVIPRGGTAKSAQGYIAIPLATIVPEATRGLRLYLRDSDDDKVRLFRAEDTAFEHADRHRLLDSGRQHVYIRQSDYGRFQNYLRENLSSILSSDGLTPQQSLGTLSDVTRSSMELAFRTLKVDQTVQRAQELAEHYADVFLRDDFIAGDVLKVLRHDFQTFTHSANVAFLSVLLGREMGLRSRQELREIAVGGLLHDLGKLEISPQILNKPGRLTEAEYTIVQEHPRTGFLKLCRRDDLTEAQLMMVYQHHERMDGHGYPVGCVGKEIHVWARICTVADVFEVLSANRPYRLSYRIPEVMKIMQRDCGRVFDEEIFQCWKNIIDNSTSSC